MTSGWAGRRPGLNPHTRNDALRKPPYSGGSIQEAPVIEWVPRSRGDDGWREVVAGSYRGHAVLEQQAGDAVVRIPVVVQDWVRIAMRRAAQRLVRLARLAFFLLLFLGFVVRALAQGPARSWPVWIGVAVLSVVAVY